MFYPLSGYGYAIFKLALKLWAQYFPVVNDRHNNREEVVPSQRLFLVPLIENGSHFYLNENLRFD